MKNKSCKPKCDGCFDSSSFKTCQIIKKLNLIENHKLYYEECPCMECLVKIPCIYVCNVYKDYESILENYCEQRNIQ